MADAGANDEFLIGREDLLDRFSAFLRAAAQGHGAISLVSGEPGIGKTSFLRAGAALASGRGFRVGWATNFEFSRSPFGALIEGLRGLLEGQEDCLPRSPLDKATLVGIMGSSEVDPPAKLDKRRFFVIVAETLIRLAQRSPWLLIIDDAHWCDPETLEFVEYLAPRLERTRGLAALAYRPDGNEDALVGLSRRIPRAEQFEVGPLSARESRLLIVGSRAPGHRLSQEIVDRIASQAEGNPLFVGELTRAALNNSKSRSATLNSLTKTRIDRLDPESRAIVEAASVIGREFDVETLCAIRQAPATVVLHALRNARDEGIIDEWSGGSAFSFQHELIRRSIYERLLIAQRREMHRQIADVLEAAQRRSTELIAMHRLAAGDAIAGAAAAEAAGDEAVAIDAIASARDWFLQTEATGILSGDDLARIKEKLGRVLILLGDSEGASMRFAAAAEHFEKAGRPERAAELWLSFAVAAHRSRRTDDAIARCKHVLTLARTDATRFGALALHAMVLAFEADTVAAAREIAAAESLIQNGNQSDRVTLAYAKLAITRFEPGDAWLEPAQSAIQFAEALGGATEIAHALINYGVAATQHGRTKDAIAALERAVEISDRNGRVFASAFARAALINVLYMSGNLREGYEIVRDAVAFHVQSTILRLTLAASAIPALADTGQLAEFPLFLDETLDQRALATGDGDNHAAMVACRLIVADAMGNVPDADSIRVALAHIRSARNFEFELYTFARLAPVAFLPHVEQLLESEPFRLEKERIYGNAARAHLALRRRSADAKETASAAIAEARRRGARLVEAGLLEAIGSTAEALKIYASCGAAARVSRIERAAESKFTPREREVAALAASGASNREIAAKLTLSERTVEHHVSSVLRKLEITSREDLPAKLGDRSATLFT